MICRRNVAGGSVPKIASMFSHCERQSSDERSGTPIVAASEEQKLLLHRCSKLMQGLANAMVAFRPPSPMRTATSSTTPHAQIAPSTVSRASTCLIGSARRGRPHCGRSVADLRGNTPSTQSDRVLATASRDPCSAFVARPAVHRSRHFFYRMVTSTASAIT